MVTKWQHQPANGDRPASQEPAFLNAGASYRRSEPLRLGIRPNPAASFSPWFVVLSKCSSLYCIRRLVTCMNGTLQSIGLKEHMLDRDKEADSVRVVKGFDWAGQSAPGMCGAWF